MTKLPYEVYCKSSYPFYELIAAFDCESAAFAYARDCLRTNGKYVYRVKYGSKSIRDFEKEST